MPMRLAAPAGYYALMATCGSAVIDCGSAFDKRDKSIRRIDIADASGLLRLTVPIAHPEHIRGTSLNELTISDHGRWWDVMLTALESAYGRTPYFEFYIDRFKPMIARPEPGTLLADMCRSMDETIRAILGIETEVAYSYEKGGRRTEVEMPEVMYTQHRQAELGFIDGLSVLDLIFCHGPESPLYLLNAINRLS